jgi:hypothetical protein
MSRHEYKITAQVDPQVEFGWEVVLWSRPVDTAPDGKWQRYNTIHVAGSYRSFIRPGAAFLEIARCLSRIPG